jgi:hypothetical protein
LPNKKLWKKSFSLNCRPPAKKEKQVGREKEEERDGERGGGKRETEREREREIKISFLQFIRWSISFDKGYGYYRKLKVLVGSLTFPSRKT